jgi:hypothetical protein
MWTEILRDISLILASWTAIYGIDAWRREYRGKRKMELAEEALCLFYETRDAIRSIRSPFGYGGEGENRKVSGEETPEQKKARDEAFVVFERYQRHQELFSKLYAMRYRFMANFGKHAAEPFDMIKKVINEIFISARMLSEMWSKNFEHWSEERTEKHIEQVRKHENIFWWSGSEDPIDKRVDEAVSRIEETTKAIIESKGTLFKILNWELTSIFKRKRKNIPS